MMAVHAHLFTLHHVLTSCMVSLWPQLFLALHSIYIDVNANITVSASDFRSGNSIRVWAKWLRASLMTGLSLGPWGHSKGHKRTKHNLHGCVNTKTHTHTQAYRYTSWAQRHTSRWPTLCVCVCLLVRFACNSLLIWKGKEVRAQLSVGFQRQEHWWGRE